MRLMWTVFWFIVAALLAATAVIANIVFNSPAPVGSTPSFESVKAALLCLGGIGVILSIYFTAVNSFIQRQADIINNTFDLLKRWDDPHLFQARKWTRKMKETKADMSENQLIEEINKNEDLKNSVILVINYFDQVRFSISTNRINKNLFKSYLGAVAVDISTRFMPYAKTIGQQAADDLNEVIKKLS